MKNETQIKNQTCDEALIFIAPNNSTGIGMFLELDENGNLRNLEYKEDISYEETIKNGEKFTSFKFFPKGIALPSEKDINEKIIVNTIDDIRRLACGVGQCGSVPCYGTCFCSHWHGNCIRY